MKTLILALIGVSSLVSSVPAFAATYHCSEITKSSGEEVLSPHTSIEIKELADITSEVSYGKHFDSVYRVDVKIMSTSRGRTTVVNSFQATATSIDVDYVVSAVRSQGVKIAIFQDEADDAYMEQTLASGRKETTQLHCE